MKARTRRCAVRQLLYTLVLTTSALCAAPPSGWAELAPSGILAAAPASGATRAADLKTITTALESKALRGRLKSMGLDDKEADARLSRLSDQDVHQLAVQLEAVRPGGFVVEVLVIVALVLVVLYLVKRV
jgi:hypothetical protein